MTTCHSSGHAYNDVREELGKKLTQSKMYIIFD